MKWEKSISAALKEQLNLNKLRYRIVTNNIGRFIINEGIKYCNFSSNDYLGLSRHPKIIQAWKNGAECYGIGSCSSSHIIGYTKIHYQFEKELSEWLEYPRALLFNSGFAANQSIIIALMKKEDYIIADRLSHASLLEAGRLSVAKLRRFKHNDIDNLELILKQTDTKGKRLVVTEGIFSMDGDRAPLKKIYSIVKNSDSWLMVDDAHGFGVVGKEGRGSCFIQQIKPELLVVTFSKGLGVSGAAVLCNDDVANYLLNYSRHLIYSTSIPPAQVTALLAALNVIRSNEGEDRRQKLNEHIHRFRKGINKFKISLLESDSAIQPLIIGENTHAENLSKFLKKRGIWSIAIRTPTVPENTARLRFTLSAIHENTDIDTLLEAIYDTIR